MSAEICRLKTGYTPPDPEPAVDLKKLEEIREMARKLNKELDDFAWFASRLINMTAAIVKLDSPEI